MTSWSEWREMDALALREWVAEELALAREDREVEEAAQLGFGIERIAAVTGIELPEVLPGLADDVEALRGALAEPEEEEEGVMTELQKGDRVHLTALGRLRVLGGKEGDEHEVVGIVDHRAAADLSERVLDGLGVLIRRSDGGVWELGDGDWERAEEPKRLHEVASVSGVGCEYAVLAEEEPSSSLEVWVSSGPARRLFGRFESMTMALGEVGLEIDQQLAAEREPEEMVPYDPAKTIAALNEAHPL